MANLSDLGGFALIATTRVCVCVLRVVIKSNH